MFFIFTSFSEAEPIGPNKKYTGNELLDHIHIPSFLTIKLGQHRQYLDKKIEAVWQSILLVAIQEGVVVYSSFKGKTLLLLSGPPVAIHISSSSPGVNVYINSVDFVNGLSRTYSIKEREYYTDKFYKKLSVQLYSDSRWNWLKTNI